MRYDNPYSKKVSSPFSPDFFAVNGHNARRNFKDFNYPTEKVIELEALRYLNLESLSHNNNKKGILILGNIVKKKTLEMLMGRKLRSNLPQLTSNVGKPSDMFRHREELIKRQGYATENPYSTLEPGQPVYVKASQGNLWKRGVVHQPCQEPDSYLVRFPDSSTLRRTRSMLKLRATPSNFELEAQERDWRPPTPLESLPSSRFVDQVDYPLPAVIPLAAKTPSVPPSAHQIPSVPSAPPSAPPTPRRSSRSTFGQAPIRFEPD